jgi:hypothetical protein
VLNKRFGIIIFQLRLDTVKVNWIATDAYKKVWRALIAEVEVGDAAFFSSIIYKNGLKEKSYTLVNLRVELLSIVRAIGFLFL